MSGWGLIGVVWVVAATGMFALWLVQRRTHNAGIVDVAWSLGTGLAAATFAAFAGGLPARRALVAALALAWGLRLGLHLARRVRGEAEDVRYRDLREKLGRRFQPWILGFFQLQAIWIVLFALPAFGAARSRAPLGALDLIGVALWIVSVGGEGLADRQLAAFRREPSHRGRVCREGLWRYTRHPNYFFEWIHWWVYVALGVGGPGWPWLLLGPIAMYLFLRFVTGIPPTEARLLASRGDAYRAYRRTTNAFFPGPPRKASS